MEAGRCEKIGTATSGNLLSFLDSPIFTRRGWLCQHFFTPSCHPFAPAMTQETEHLA